MTDAGIEIIRRSSFTAIPWKNGGGITHEAIRVPPTGEAFLWRVSVAQIDSSGPFSDFAGYDRKMVLLRGQGIALEFGNGEASCVAQHRRLGRIRRRHVHSLRAARWAVRGFEPHRVQVAADRGARRACERAYSGGRRCGETTLIFGIQDPLSLDGRGESARLEPWDLAILSDCSAHLSKTAPGEDSAPSAVFIATISP